VRTDPLPCSAIEDLKVYKRRNASCFIDPVLNLRVYMSEDSTLLTHTYLFLGLKP
jgi:hypothetical protein